VHLRTRRDTERLGRAIGERLRPGDLVVLAGELGAGKTALAGGIARGLGVPASERVTSPTFTLVQEYDTPTGKLLHADLHRLLDAPGRTRDEVERLGLRERRAEGCIVVVEWGEGAIDWLGGDPALVVKLDVRRDGRDAALSGPRAAELP
jgi:tRNA threonylcarbamoyladenosine biosynthesis protein TsaE